MNSMGMTTKTLPKTTKRTNNLAALTSRVLQCETRVSHLETNLHLAFGKIAALELVLRELTGYTDAISLDVDELLGEDEQGED